MSRNVTIGVTVTVMLVLAGLTAFTMQIPQKPIPEHMDSLVVAYSPFESTALFWVAVDQHFFEKNDINITLLKYDSGAAALDGVVNGEADVAVGITEYPLVRKAFQNTQVRALGNIDKGDFIYIVARQDRGIRNESDLKGKRVGTTKGTIAEFHLGRFLTLHGMSMQDITLVDIKTPEGWVNAVAEGEIDAISTAQPYANAARDRIGENAVVWSAQSSQPLFALVVSTDSWITAHPDPAVRFLRSLAEAEDYLGKHPEESRAIVQNHLGLDPGYMDSVWQQNQFALTMDQSLITAMEDEARWMIVNNMTDAGAVPDFRKYVYSEGIEMVKSGSVHII